MLGYIEGTHRLQFDSEEYDFRDIVLRHINAHSNKSGYQSIEKLEDIHTIPEIENNVESYRQVVFESFRSEEFQFVFKAFGGYLIDNYFDGSGLIQKTPTVRIQLPRANSTSYHSDGWYGHGNTVRSFWMPLVDVAPGNTLYMAKDINESRACLDKILLDRASLSEINNIASQACEPFTGEYGDMLSFSSEMVHGAEQNTLGYSRVSFDFRIAPYETDLGTKPRSNFFSRQELEQSDGQVVDAESRDIELSGITYSNKCQGISAKAQLMLCSAFAAASDIGVVGNESEILTLNYMPVLRHYLITDTNMGNTVIVFGLEIFEGNVPLAKEVLSLAAENNKHIVFCAQGIVFGRDTSDIEAVLKSLSH